MSNAGLPPRARTGMREAFLSRDMSGDADCYLKIEDSISSIFAEQNSAVQKLARTGRGAPVAIRREGKPSAAMRFGDRELDPNRFSKP